MQTAWLQNGTSAGDDTVLTVAIFKLQKFDILI